MTQHPEVDESEVAAAIVALASDVPRPQPLQQSARSGVYTIRITAPDLLKPFKEADSGLIYCGMSADLEAREFDMHFDSTQTGFSTVRRSLGAILKEQLGLKARPRGTGASNSNFTNYRFDVGGDERLTEWMRNHLEVRTWSTRKHKALERILKPNLRPLLNLEKWNPYDSDIRALRKVCADEARLGRSR